MSSSSTPASSIGRTEVLRSRPAQAATIAYVLVGIWYLWWRTFDTVNPDALWLSLPLLFADYLGFAFFFLFAINLWSRIRRYPPEPEDGLSVDVFIPTYNEPLDILRPTIVSALAMDYPHKTYVLDDGRREHVRRLCEELGADYLTRTDNRGAKAGNINAALPKTDGELIAIFDADHAPYRNFLTSLLGYFRDEKVALAQAPQAYYNLDSFQHGVGKRSGGNSPWHEQSVFYDVILPGKDRWNAAFWCGSTAIVRRTALEEIGGVDTRTITEDMHTAMGMHARGWKSVYHDRELALGIAPDDLEQFLVQRLRWAEGAIQILRRHNPLFHRGLSLKQRVSYFTSVAYVIEYVPKAIYLAMPPVVLLTGTLPMNHMGWNLLFRFAPYYLLGTTATILLTGGTNPFLHSERFHLVKMEIMFRALTSLVWPRKLKFKVTAKGASETDSRFRALKLVKFQLALGGLCLVSAVWAISSAIIGAPWRLSFLALVMTAVWAVINAGMVASLAGTVLRRHHRRSVYRFPVDVPLSVTIAGTTASVTARDISALGIGWQSLGAVAPGCVVHSCLEPGAGPAIEADLRVTSCRPGGDGLFDIGAEITSLSPESQRALVLFLFQTVAPQSLGQNVPQAESEPIELEAHRRHFRRAG